jgi:hypothetical protein
LSSPGKSARYAPKPIPKPSSQKKVAQLAKPNASVSPAMFDQSALSMHLRTMNVLEFGAAYQSANVDALNVILRKLAAL